MSALGFNDFSGWLGFILILVIIAIAGITFLVFYLIGIVNIKLKKSVEGMNFLIIGIINVLCIVSFISCIFMIGKVTDMKWNIIYGMIKSSQFAIFLLLIIKNIRIKRVIDESSKTLQQVNIKETFVIIRFIAIFLLYIIIMIILMMIDPEKQLNYLYRKDLYYGCEHKPIRINNLILIGNIAIIISCIIYSFYVKNIINQYIKQSQNNLSISDKKKMLNRYSSTKIITMLSIIIFLLVIILPLYMIFIETSNTYQVLFAYYLWNIICNSTIMFIINLLFVREGIRIYKVSSKSRSMKK